jgi:hypothetical protein
MRNILVLLLFLSSSSILFCQKKDDSVLSFVLYQGEDFYVPSDSLFPNLLHQLNFEFPVKMHDKDVLCKIQQQLIDTIFYGHYQTTSLDSVARLQGYRVDTILYSNTYPHEVPNDREEYFDYGNSDRMLFFFHKCGRTEYNQDSLYIVKYHYTQYEGGAHHWYGTKYLAFDTRTGEFVSFKDIFGGDIKHVIMEAIQQQYPDLFLMPLYDLDAATFTIGKENIIFHYNPGYLGCWADGERYIEIPIDTAKLFLSPNWKHLFQ